MATPLALLLALSAAAQPLPQIKFSKTDDATASAPAPSPDSPEDCLAKLGLAQPPAIDGQALPAGNFDGKVAGRAMPSAFMAWEPAGDPGGDTTSAARTARKAASLPDHDLIWMGAGSWGLSWGKGPQGLATSFTGTPLPAGADTLRLAEIRWFDGMYVDGDATKQFLPKDHPFWQLPMTRADSTLTSPMFMLNYHDACVQEQVARQCKAAIAAGLDGCMLDRWSDIDQDAAVGILSKIRGAIGSSGVVIVNSNGHNPQSPNRGGQVLAASAPYINGVFAEGFGEPWFFSRKGATAMQVPLPPADDWRYLVDDLKALEAAPFQSPRVDAMEGWGDAGNEQYVRALTAAVMTYSSAYVLYSRPNQFIPNHDHAHDFDALWQRKLGTASAAARELGGGAAQREYSGGTVVFNGSGASIQVSFPETRTSRATGQSGTLFSVPALDGDLFFK